MEINHIDEDLEENDVSEEVLSMHQSKKTLIYALHVHVNQFELHLDGITHKYKAISLMWLLATYVAIGFLFSAEFKAVELNSLIGVSAVCLFGVIGITSIWYIDIHTIQKFWSAFFIEGVKMENKYKYLLQIGDFSVSLNTVKSRIRGHENCYVFANLILLISTGIALLLLIQSTVWRIVVCVSILFFLIIMIKLIRNVGNKLIGMIESLLKKTIRKVSN